MRQKRNPFDAGRITGARLPVTKLYAWRPDNKASAACIRHFIVEAIERKRWAESVTAEWLAGASFMSAQWVCELRSHSVHQIAREKLEYCRHRAGMNGAYGAPMDRPARDLWQSFKPAATAFP